MNKRSVITLMLGMCLGTTPMALAQEAEKTSASPWLCVPIEEIECGPTGECQSNALESLNIPQFIKVDLAAKQLSGQEEGKIEAAAIQHMAQLDGQLVLQGVQDGRGWSLVIVEQTGQMTLSAAGEQVAWLAFGACTPLADWGKTENTIPQ